MPRRAAKGYGYRKEPGRGKSNQVSILDKLKPIAHEDTGSLKLDDGSRVCVVGAGPAGSFFSYFLLRLAKKVGIDLHLDIYEPRDFTKPGPGGCNMCGGIISESLVQFLAAEGINLPSSVVKRGIDSYKLHMDVGSVLIETPLQEKRIGAVHRGPGPKTVTEAKWDSFDGHLLERAVEKGANVIMERVEKVRFENGRPRVETKNRTSEPYDLLVAATGINSAAVKMFEGLEIGYQSPQTTKTAIVEFFLGPENLNKYLGNSMHVFLLNIPRLEFGAIIPKGDYATVCLLGHEIDKKLLQDFLEDPVVRACFPPDWDPKGVCCNCLPKMNVGGVPEPFADRVVFVGDCGMNRLNKDGIGGAYRVAKAAANCAVLDGISAEAFRRSYLPTCNTIGADNQIGKFVFSVVGLIQRLRFARRTVLRMASHEQLRPGGKQRISNVLWDTFTGSAPYREILMRTVHPVYLAKFFMHMTASLWPSGEEKRRRREER